MKLKQPALGKILRAARKESGQTMEAIANKMKVSQSLLYRIESGGDLMVKTLVRIAAAYQLEITFAQKKGRLRKARSTLLKHSRSIDWRAVRGMISNW
jgi:transcriptional regulator with XRE-family HTH domain